jgi:hypothetical protein
MCTVSVCIDRSARSGSAQECARVWSKATSEKGNTSIPMSASALTPNVDRRRGLMAARQMCLDNATCALGMVPSEHAERRAFPRGMAHRRASWSRCTSFGNF